MNFDSVWCKLKSIGNRLVCLSLPQNVDHVSFPWCKHSFALGLRTSGSKYALKIMQVFCRDKNTSGQRHRYCFDANRHSRIAWNVTTRTLLENAQDLLRSAEFCLNNDRNTRKSPNKRLNLDHNGIIHGSGVVNAHKNDRKFRRFIFLDLFD